MTNSRLSCVAPLFLVVASALAQRQPIAESERSVHLYDVRDLLTSTGIDTESGIEVPQPLVQLVRAFLPVPVAQPGDIAAVGGSHLVAAATAEQHAWIERFLQRARQGKDALVEIDATTLAIPLDVFARDVAPVLEKAAPAAERDPSWAVLGAGEASDLFLRRLRQRDGVVESRRLHLTARLLQGVNVFSGEQCSYIKDFAIELAQGQMIADPIIGVVEDGARLRCVVGLLEDGALGLVMESSVSMVTKPIAQVMTKIAGTQQEATVQLPRQRVARVRAALALPHLGVAVLALPAIDDLRFLVAVRARLIADVGAQAPIRDEPSACVYDVKDLLGFTPPVIKRPGELAPQPPPEAENGSANLLGLAEVARAFVDPPLRSDEQLTSASPAHLVLKARPAQQAWLERFLLSLRDAPAASWTVHPQVVVLPTASYEQHVLSLLRASGLRRAASGGEQAVLASADAERVLGVAKVQPNVEASDLGAVSTQRLQKTTAGAALRYESYIKDFDVRVVDGKTIGHPIEDVVRHGPLLTWHLVPLPAGEVGLALDVQLMHLQQPIAKFTTSLGLGEPATIQLPRVTLGRAAAALTVPSGRVAVVVLPAAERGKQAVVFLHIEAATPGTGR